MAQNSSFGEALQQPQREAFCEPSECDVPRQFASSSADNELAAAARKALEASGYQQVAKLTVAVNDGEVLVRGTVARYHLKQVAQATLSRVPGVVRLRNEIAVSSRSKAEV